MSRRARVGALAAAVMATVVLAACGSSGSTQTGSVSAAASAGPTAKKTVGVALIAPVALLENNVAHFKAELAAKGFVAGKNLTYDSFNADGSVSNVESIVTRLTQLHPSLVYLVGTPLVEAFAEKRSDTPVVFGAMTDPVGSKVIPNLAKPGGEITGTTDAVPPSLTIKLLTETIPGVKRVGVINNPSEQNSVSEVAGLTSAAKAHGIQLVDKPADSTGDVASAIRALQGVQALVVPNDNTVFSALGTVVQTANQMRLPTFSTAGGSAAQQGIMVAYGVNYNALGSEAGDLSAAILHGSSPGGLAVRGLFNGAPSQIGVNLKTARTVGVELPASVRSQASLVFGR